MAAEEHLSEDAGDFERALGTLNPCVRGVDRDQLMFLAGKMSVERSPALAGSARWLWPAATATSTIAAAVLGILFAVQIGREPVRQRTGIVPDRVAVDEEGPPKDAADSLSDGAGQGAPEPMLDVDPDGQLADARVAQPDYLRLRTALMDGVEALPLPIHSASLDAEPPASYWQSTQLLRDERANKYPGRKSNLLDSTLFFGFGEKL